MAGAQRAVKPSGVSGGYYPKQPPVTVLDPSRSMDLFDHPLAQEPGDVLSIIFHKSEFRRRADLPGQLLSKLPPEVPLRIDTERRHGSSPTFHVRRLDGIDQTLSNVIAPVQPQCA